MANITLTRKVDDGIQMLEFLKDIMPDVFRIQAVVEENPAMFGVGHILGQSKMKIAADYLEFRAKEFKKRGW